MVSKKRSTAEQRRTDMDSFLWSEHLRRLNIDPPSGKYAKSWAFFLKLRLSCAYLIISVRDVVRFKVIIGQSGKNNVACFPFLTSTGDWQ